MQPPDSPRMRVRRPRIHLIRSMSPQKVLSWLKGETCFPPSRVPRTTPKVMTPMKIQSFEDNGRGSCTRIAYAKHAQHAHMTDWKTIILKNVPKLGRRPLGTNVCSRIRVPNGSVPCAVCGYSLRAWQ